MRPTRPTALELRLNRMQCPVAQVNWYFTPKGPAKCMVSVQHAKLAGKADIDKLKAFWDERLDALGEVLRQAGSADR